MFPFISGFMGGVDSVVLLSLAIILCASLFEDITTVIIGVLAADGIIPIPIAFISLCTGVVIGDMVLYSLGSFARMHPRLAQYIDHNFTTTFRLWLGQQYAYKILSGHFVPGFRFATFVTSGFFRYPLRTYIPMAITGGIVSVILFFSVSYWFGSITTGWISHARWGVAGAFLIAFFLIGRHNIRAYREQRSTLKNGNSV